VLAAWLLRTTFSSVFQQQVPFLFYFAAVMISAWYGGLWPGLLSTGLSGALVALAEAMARNVAAVPSRNITVLITIFLIEGVLISVLCEAMHRARDRALSEQAERQEAEESQQELEQRFRATFEQAAVGIAHVAPDGRWLRVNQKLCAILGYSPDELLQLRFQDVTYPPDLQADMELANRMLAGEIETYALEKRYICKNGALIWINLTAALVREDDGAPKYFIAIIEDISERKATEQALQESEARFRSMADSAPILLWVAGADAGCTFFNKSWLEFTGRRMAQELGNGWAEGIHPDDAPRVLDDYLTAFAARQPFQIDYRLRRYDGEYRWLLDHGAPRTSPDGGFAGFIGSCIDITERKRLEESQSFLAEASAVLTSSLDYASTLSSVARLVVPRMADMCTIDLVDEDGAITRPVHLHANPAQQALFDEIARNYLPGDEIHVSAASTAIRTGKTVFWPVVRTLAPDEVPEAYWKLVQQLKPCSAIAAPLIVAGRTLGALSLFTSESERRYTEADVSQVEELARRAAVAVDNARLYKEAQDAVRVREAFLSIAAHELKTPLTALLGYTNVLERRAQREQALSERNQRTLQAIGDQGERLNRLIESLLDLSRIQTGRLSIELQQVDLAALARSVVAEMQPTLERHTIEISAPETLTVEGDGLRLEQVLHNLLHNAIKYSPTGGPVEIRLRQENGDALLSVSDQGIGIPQTAQENLFQRFFRAGNVDPRQISGLGIGLFVVSEIVSRHGGAIEVQSQEGVGSTFTVRLPILGPKTDASRAQDAASAPSAVLS
jgi:PAS domain S-box-containing protein